MIKEILVYWKSDQTLRVALLWSWLILTIISLLVIMITFLFPDSIILSSAPTCFSIRMYGQSCFMCGSTRAFMEISNGNFGGAFQLNRLSPFLYFFFIINGVICFFTVFKKGKIYLFNKSKMKN